MTNAIETKIFDALVPAKTDTYSPVSHRNIVEAIQEECDKRGFVIETKEYWENRGSQQVTGKFNIRVSGDDELGMMTAFRNSYDRSMSLGFATGGNVWICLNGQVGGDITLVRRHTGGISTEVEDKIVQSMEHLEEEYQKLSKQNAIMKEMELSSREMAELVGRMFVEENLINSTQLNIVKREMIGEGTNHFTDNNVWSSYNNVTEAYKKSSAYSYLDNHIELHQFFEKEFKLTV
ncbi:MAG: DUF932 domain-containing protein [Candidatus Heimdallarchaeota archaeon]